MFDRLHELADEAYFANTLLVCAANNVAGSVLPVAFRRRRVRRRARRRRPRRVVLQPEPPVEFGAHGLDVDVAWRDGARIRATGNSFAAPHLAGPRRAALRATRRATPVRGQGDACRDRRTPGHDRHRPGGPGGVVVGWATKRVGLESRLVGPSTSSSSSIGDDLAALTRASMAKARWRRVDGMPWPSTSSSMSRRFRPPRAPRVVLRKLDPLVRHVRTPSCASPQRRSMDHRSPSVASAGCRAATTAAVI